MMKIEKRERGRKRRHHIGDVVRVTFKLREIAGYLRNTNLGFTLSFIEPISYSLDLLRSSHKIHRDVRYHLDPRRSISGQTDQSSH